MSRAVSPRVAIIVALSVEQAAWRRLARGGAGAFSVEQSGPGPVRAAEHARAALEAGAGALVSFGLAGGVDAPLGAGAVMVPRRVRAADGPVYAVDDGWRAVIAQVLGAELAVSDADLLSTAEPLLTPAAKRAAATLGVAAVDTESAAIAAVAATARVPFIAVRVIVDTAADVLPPAAVAWVDERGNRRFAAALTAAAKPLQWLPLWTLAQRYRAASRVLARAAALMAGSRVLTVPAAAGSAS